jgi:hypothetical protein
VQHNKQNRQKSTKSIKKNTHKCQPKQQGGNASKKGWLGAISNQGKTPGKGLGQTRTGVDAPTNKSRTQRGEWGEADNRVTKLKKKEPLQKKTQSARRSRKREPGENG